MGFEAETETETVKQKKSIAKLPLFSIPAMQMQTEKSGMMTPPLHASAAVPFRWEQVPGKPRPCSALIAFSNNPNSFQLPLPPRLLIPSPYPYASNTNTNTFRSPSFRMLLTKPPGPGGVKDYAWFASWRRKTFTLKKRDQVTGASHIFPASSSSSHNKDDTHFPKIKRSGTATATIWTSICEGFKHVVPWKNKKLKKHGF